SSGSGSSSGSSGSSGAGDAGSDASTDGGSHDSGGADAPSDSPGDADQCAPITDNAAQITTTTSDAAAPAPGSFTGGTIESGTYWVTAFVYYQGSVTGTMKQEFVIDATAHTIQQADIENGGLGTKNVYATSSYTTSSNQLSTTSIC